MAGHAQPNLPQITRFLAGMVTNRNPIDTPFQIIGLNIVQHHDALNDGLNMEISAYNTLMRRPGFSSFFTAVAQPRDFFMYKDLSGNLSLFYDQGGLFYHGATEVQGFVDANQKPWSLVGIGNFVYTANGSNFNRFNAPNLSTAWPVGIKPLTTPPRLTVSTQSKALFLSDFVPNNDAIGGTLVVTDTATNRTLTITISTGNIHFNVTLLGLPISTISSYTQTDTKTVAGSVTTDVFEQSTGMTGTATGTGVSNGVLAYYPNQGLSTLDFDVNVAGTITLTLLAATINGVQNLNITETDFTTEALVPLKVFVLASVIAGQAASTYFPDTPAVAMALTGNGA